MFLRLQNVILDMVARGVPLAATARRLCLEAELLAPGCVCSILTVDSAGLLHPLGGPSLPASYSQAVDSLPIGPAVGSCGTAAYRMEPVVVTDIATDPLWTNYKALALPLGLVACWSSPIFGETGRVIGTFAFYYSTPRGPNVAETDIVATCVNLCAIALQRDEAEARNHRLAYFDNLTELGNRASFNLALERVDLREPDSFGLMLIDIDRLKVVNDTLGHAGGDDLIREVGMRIGRNVGSGQAYRLGGDEFAVMVSGAGAVGRVEMIADKILSAMKPGAICGGYELQPTVTIGAAIYDRDGNTVEAIRQNADFALYHAKEKTRGAFLRHTPGLGTTITQRFHAIGEIRTAFDEQRIEAHYQPVVRLDTAEIIGLEALCRVRNRHGELVSAVEFQQAMTDATTATRVTERMLTNVAGDVRKWLDAGIPFQHVGINVTTGDFQRGDLEQRIATTFDRFGVPLRHVILEVTESVYMGDSDQMVAQAVKALRGRGLLVALDDFGTGFASLTHLLTFPVDVIKIDRSFVSGLQPGAPSGVIVEALIQIASKLDMRIVAEGVETEQQAKQLQALGCRLAQGYYFARPSNFLAVTEMLERSAQRPPRSAPARSVQTAA